MVDFRANAVRLEQKADLVEGRALLGEHAAGQHLLGLLVEEIVLREDPVGLVFGRRRCRPADRIQHHDHRGNAAIGLRLLGDELDAEVPVGLPCLAVQEQLLAGIAVQGDQRLRQRQRLRRRRADGKQQGDGGSGQPSKRREHHRNLLGAATCLRASG